MGSIYSGDRCIFNVLRIHVDWCVVNDVSERVSASIFGIVHEDDHPEYWDTIIWNMRSYTSAHCLFIHSCVHLVVCITTGPKPLPKRTFHLVRSRALSFKWVSFLSLGSSSTFLRLRLHVDWCVVNDVSERISASIFWIVHDDHSEYLYTIIWNMRRYTSAYCLFIQSFISLSYDRSKASSKASCPHSAI